jgi:periodic tryptophan protein 2
MAYCGADEPSASNKSFTFPFENRKNIAAIALSPEGNILISIDEGTLLALSSYSAGYIFIR